MEQFGHARVAQQALQVGRLDQDPARRRWNAHEMAVAVAGGELHQTEAVTVRVEAHGLGIDRNAGPEIEPIRQVALVQADVHRLMSGHASACLQWCDGRETGDGAQEKTRTSTTFRPQVPETCASANSATWATEGAIVVSCLPKSTGISLLRTRDCGLYLRPQRRPRQRPLPEIEVDHGSAHRHRLRRLRLYRPLSGAATGAPRLDRAGGGTAAGPRAVPEADGGGRADHADRRQPAP